MDRQATHTGSEAPRKKRKKTKRPRSSIDKTRSPKPGPEAERSRPTERSTYLPRLQQSPLMYDDEALTGTGLPALGDSEQCRRCGSWMDYACDDMFMLSFE